MTRVSYARILIKVDLFYLPSTVTMLLPNGNTLVQQLVYESLPRFCKHCKSLGHSTPTCTKGHVPRNRKRPHDNSASSSPSVETAVVEKQDQYCAGPSINLQEDPMSTKVATTDPKSTQSPGHKRSKVDDAELSDPIPAKVGTAPILKRQYLTRSKSTAIPCIGLKPNSPVVVFQSLHSSDSSGP